jgi:glycosyltransferase involved in cell wall biosynthesis
MDARMESSTGIGRYVRSLGSALLQNPETDLRLFVSSGPRPAWRKDPRITTTAYDARIYSLKEQIVGAALSRRYRDRTDVFHFPNYNAPWFLPERSVVTLHDLTQFLFPSYFPAARRLLAGLVLRRVVRRAGRILAVSEATRTDLERFSHRARGKTVVVPHGVDPVFRRLSTDVVESFRSREDLRRFVLYVGNSKPHKNLVRLMQAFALLGQKFRDVDLVLVTQTSIDVGRLGERIRVVTDVSDDQLVLWYNAAEVLVLPSLNEGFGLTAIEAMACATPVVASNVKALTETVGDAGLLVDPYDTRALCEAMGSLLSNASRRCELASKALLHSSRYTWAATAERTMRVYESVAHG